MREITEAKPATSDLTLKAGASDGSEMVVAKVPQGYDTKIKHSGSFRGLISGSPRMFSVANPAKERRAATPSPLPCRRVWSAN